MCPALLRVRETYPDKAAYEAFLVTNYQPTYSYSKTEPRRLEALERVEQMIKTVNAWRSGRRLEAESAAGAVPAGDTETVMEMEHDLDGSSKPS
jgi:hypothetical protein